MTPSADVTPDQVLSRLEQYCRGRSAQGAMDADVSSQVRRTYWIVLPAALTVFLALMWARGGEWTWNLRRIAPQLMLACSVVAAAASAMSAARASLPERLLSKRFQALEHRARIIATWQNHCDTGFIASQCVTLANEVLREVRSRSPRDQELSFAYDVLRDAQNLSNPVDDSPSTVAALATAQRDATVELISRLEATERRATLAARTYETAYKATITRKSLLLIVPSFLSVGLAAPMAAAVYWNYNFQFMFLLVMSVWTGVAASLYDGQSDLLMADRIAYLHEIAYQSQWLKAVSTNLPAALLESEVARTDQELLDVLNLVSPDVESASTASSAPDTARTEA